MFGFDDLLITSAILSTVTTISNLCTGIIDRSERDHEKLVDKTKRRSMSDRESATQLITRAIGQVRDRNYPAAIIRIDEAIALWNPYTKVKKPSASIPNSHPITSIIASVSTFFEQVQQIEKTALLKELESPNDKNLLADFYSLKGQVLYKMGKLEESKIELEEAARLDNPRPLLHLTLAVVYQQLGQKERAIDCLREIMGLCGGDPGSVQGFLARLYLHVVHDKPKLLAADLENFDEEKLKNRHEDQGFLALIYFLQAESSEKHHNINAAIKQYNKSLAIAREASLAELHAKIHIFRARCLMTKAVNSVPITTIPGWEKAWGERYGIDLPNALSIYCYPKIFGRDAEVKESDMTFLYFIPQKFKRLNQWMHEEFDLGLEEITQQFSTMKRRVEFKPIVANTIYELIRTGSFLRDPNVPRKQELDILLDEKAKIMSEKNDALVDIRTAQQNQAIEREFAQRLCRVQANILKLCADDALIDYYEQHHLIGNGWKPFFQCGSNPDIFMLAHLLKGSRIDLYIFKENNKILELVSAPSVVAQTPVSRKRLYMLHQQDRKINQGVLRPICNITSEKTIFTQLALLDLKAAKTTNSVEALYWLAEYDDEAKDELLGLANKGHLTACFYIGKHFLEGKTPQIDLLKAIRYLHKSLSGNPSIEMRSEAQRLMREALQELAVRAQGDSPNAISANTDLGFIYFDGRIEGKPNYPLAYPYLKKAAEARDPRAMYFYARLHGEKASPYHDNIAEGMIWYVRAKNAGYVFSDKENAVFSKFLNVRLYLVEAGFHLYYKKSFSEAAYFLELAINPSLLFRPGAESLNLLGAMHQRGQHYPQDYEAAYRYFYQAFEIFNQNKLVDPTLPRSIFLHLGCLSLYGKGTIQDYEKALFYFSKIAENQDQLARAMFEFTEHYMVDKRKSEKKTEYPPLRRVWCYAELQPGSLFLGLNRALGRGVGQSNHEADDYFQKAKELPLDDDIYCDWDWDGEGMYWPTFLEWQTELANKGLTSAQVLLGVVYDYGLLNESSSATKANEWYQRAAAASVFAKHRLSILAPVPAQNVKENKEADLVSNNPQQKPQTRRLFADLWAYLCPREQQHRVLEQLEENQTANNIPKYR